MYALGVLKNTSVLRCNNKTFTKTKRILTALIIIKSLHKSQILKKTRKFFIHFNVVVLTKFIQNNIYIYNIIYYILLYGTIETQ